MKKKFGKKITQKASRSAFASTHHAMSMFRSLQQLPGTITLFHNSSSIASQELFKFLASESNKLPASPAKKASFLSKITGQDVENKRKKFELNMSNSFPTLDQFNFIKSTIPLNPGCKEAFCATFPQLSKHLEDESDYLNELPSDDKMKQLVSDRSTEDLIRLGFYNPPLAVDWSNSTIAHDIEGARKMVSFYEKSE